MWLGIKYENWISQDRQLLSLFHKFFIYYNKSATKEHCENFAIIKSLKSALFDERTIIKFRFYFCMPLLFIFSFEKVGGRSYTLSSPMINDDFRKMLSEWPLATCYRISTDKWFIWNSSDWHFIDLVRLSPSNFAVVSLFPWQQSSICND